MNKFFSSWVLLLAIWQFLPLIFATNDFSGLGYSYAPQMAVLWVYFTFICCFVIALFWGYYLAARIAAPKQPNAIGLKYCELIFLFCPIPVISILVFYAILNFQLGVSLDMQPYFALRDQLIGDVLIHLLPIGVTASVLLHERLSKICLSVVVMALVYSILYTERLFFVQVVFACYVGYKFGRGISIKSLHIILLAVFLLMLFLMSEFTRAYVFKKLSTDWSIYESILYGLERLFLYYADPTYKSAQYLHDLVFEGTQASSRYSWETPLLTNRGATWTLLEVFNLAGIAISLLIAFFCGAVFGMAKRGYLYALLLSSVICMVAFEYPRVAYFGYSRFWIPVLSLLVLLLLNTLLRRSAVMRQSV